MAGATSEASQHGHAAAADFGAPAMVELPLKMGANPAARTQVSPRETWHAGTFTPI
ncbi:MAG: hypothetical protein ABSH32_05150 [Bryobacteraceae bacterium]